MAIIESEGSGSKVALAGLALENSEFPVEMTNEMKSFFDEEWFGTTVLVWAFCGSEVHT